MTERSAAPRRFASAALGAAGAFAAAVLLSCGGDAPGGGGMEPDAGGTPAVPGTPEFTDPIVFQRFANTGATPTVPGFYGGADIWIMDGDGGGLRLVRKGVPAHLDHPSLSLDLRTVVYAEFNDADAGVEGGARIFREDLATAEREVLREVEGCAVHHASISPINQELTYTRNCPEGDGFNQGLITEFGDRRRLDASITTALRIGNGVGLNRAVLFQGESDAVDGERRMEIAIIRFDGYGQGTYTALTDREHRHRRPAVSPDGRTIAWQTNRSGPTDDIFLADIDGSNQRRLTMSNANDGHPWFSRDGRSIVFESDRTGNWEIWKIEIETGEVVQLTDDPAYVSTRPRW